MSDISVPERLANGDWPDAERFMADYDWLLAVNFGTFLINGGQETWTTTSFTNPSHGASLSTSWTLSKTGTSAPTANISRESTVIDSTAGTYSMKIDITVAGSSNSLIGIYQAAQNIAALKGYTVAFGAKVRAATATKVRLKVTDGTTTQYSDYHSGGSTFEHLHVTIAVSASASSLTCTIETISDFTGAVYIDNAYTYIVPAQISDDGVDGLVYVPLLDNIGGYLALSGGTLTGDVVFSSTQNFPVVNHCDNASFDIWQRGTSFTGIANNAYSADRWKFSKASNRSTDITKETSVTDVGAAALKFVAGAGNTTEDDIFQYAENYQEFRGRTITVSMRVRSNTASATRLWVNDAVANYYSSYHSGGSTYETLSVTITVDASASQLLWGVTIEKASTGYVDNVMVVLGSTATPFIPTPRALDMNRCLRFYQRFGGHIALEEIAQGQCYTTTNWYVTPTLKTPMRAAPTLTVNNATHFNVYDAAAAVKACATVVANTACTESFSIGGTVASGLVAGDSTRFETSNIDAVIEASADL